MSSSFSSSMPVVPIWFQDWRPQSVGATFAACLGLSFLAVLYKFTAYINSRINKPTRPAPPPQPLDDACDSLINQPDALGSSQKPDPCHDYPDHLNSVPTTARFSDYLLSGANRQQPTGRRLVSRWSHRFLTALAPQTLLRCLLVTLQAGLGYLIMVRPVYFSRASFSINLTSHGQLSQTMEPD